MSCSGTMGRVAIAPDSLRRGIINQALLKLTPNEKVSPDFLKLWMESAAFQEAVKESAGGVAIQNVASVSMHKEIRIPLPSISEQSETMTVVDDFAAEVHRLEIVYRQKVEALDDLKKSLLHHAFSGQL